MELNGTLQYKLGQVLGASPETSRQYQSVRANKFLKGNQKKISIEELSALAKFFNKNISYFLEDKSTGRNLTAKESGESYGKISPYQIDNMSETEINDQLKNMDNHNSEILKNAPLSTLGLVAKQAILKAYYSD